MALAKADEDELLTLKLSQLLDLADHLGLNVRDDVKAHRKAKRGSVVPKPRPGAAPVDPDEDAKKMVVDRVISQRREQAVLDAAMPASNRVGKKEKPPKPGLQTWGSKSAMNGHNTE